METKNEDIDRNPMLNQLLKKCSEHRRKLLNIHVLQYVVHTNNITLLLVELWDLTIKGVSRILVNIPKNHKN